MNQKLFDLQMKSIAEAIGHLRLIDLRELADCAIAHGNDDDKVLIASLMIALATLPPGHR
jgi:hypothetical protein